VGVLYVFAVRDLERGSAAGFAKAWVGVWHRLWRLVVVQLVATVLVALLVITIVGIPYGIKKYVDWQLAQAGDPVRGPLDPRRAAWQHPQGAKTLVAYGRRGGHLLAAQPGSRAGTGVRALVYDDPVRARHLSPARQNPRP
jgi:hypothetical protein